MNIKSSFWLRRAITISFCGCILAATLGCARPYTSEEMQPLAATATDLARAVMRYAAANPNEAALLDDQALVRRATAYDPKLLEPYDGLVVRGTADGVILVCTSDGKVALIEDAECTDKVDKLLWPEGNVPCQFSLKLDTLCP